MKPNPKEINIILNILKRAQLEFLPQEPFYIDTPLMCPILIGFRDTAISLYSSKIVDKEAILCTVANSGIYCSSEKVGTVYLV
jgi:hypothetical protein